MKEVLGSVVMSLLVLFVIATMVAGDCSNVGSQAGDMDVPHCQQRC